MSACQTANARGAARIGARTSQYGRQQESRRGAISVRFVGCTQACRATCCERVTAPVEETDHTSMSLKYAMHACAPALGIARWRSSGAQAPCREPASIRDRPQFGQEAQPREVVSGHGHAQALVDLLVQAAHHDWPIGPIALPQPKDCSMHLRRRWLVA